MNCNFNCKDCPNRDCVENPARKIYSRGFLSAAGSYRGWWLENKSPYEQRQRRCANCGEPFVPGSPSQKYCSREDNPACADERWLQGLPRRSFIARTGLTVKEFIRTYGIDTYKRI